MKQVNPEGYRRYLLKHDLGDKLAEQKSKVENLHVYVTQITKIENTKPVYDNINEGYLNSIKSKCIVIEDNNIPDFINHAKELCPGNKTGLF